MFKALPLSHCAECGERVASTRLGARFCSMSCSKRAEKRRYKTRNPDKIREARKRRRERDASARPPRPPPKVYVPVGPCSIVCAGCGEAVEVKRKARFCSAKCRQRHRDRSRDNGRRDPEKVRASRQRYRARHREKIAAKKAAWKAANPGKIAAHRANEYAERNRQRTEARALRPPKPAPAKSLPPEERRRLWRERYATDPRYRESVKAAFRRYGQTDKGKALAHRRNHARRAAVKAAELAFGAADWRRVRERQRGRCYFCDAEAKLTLDHRIPLCVGGPLTPENAVGACQACNSSKRDRFWPLRVEQASPYGRRMNAHVRAFGWDDYARACAAAERPTLAAA